MHETSWSKCLHHLKLTVVLFFQKFWLVSENNYSPTSLKYSVRQQPHTGWMETDGNNRQPRAHGLCSIDPIALIKVVYREYTLSNDGWLLVIIQQPGNITPLICGVLTQSVKLILAPLTPDKKVPDTSWASVWHVWKVQGKVMGQEWMGVKDTKGLGGRKREGALCCVCDHDSLPRWSPRQSERARVEGSELIAF